jgi:hypothetical protein
MRLKTLVTWRMKASPVKSKKTDTSKKGVVMKPEMPASHRRHCLVPSPNPVKEWKKAKLKTEDLLTLVNSGFLHEKDMDLWRTAIGDSYPMEKNLDEIPMYAWFMERGLALSASDFFKGILRYYGIEYLNLNPNGIFNTSIFVHFYEAFLGIKPHWILFWKFFRVKPQPSTDDPRVVGGAAIQIREDVAGQYPPYKLIDSNQD